MRIRSIRPEFWSSEDVASMDWNTRLVFIGLWSYVDDNGVGRDVEKLIVAALFPLDDDLREASVRTHGALKHLNTGGQVTRYRVDGKPYLHITAWETNQKINRPSEGRYPLPTSTNAHTPALFIEPSVSPHRTLSAGEGEKGRRGEGEKGAPTVQRATQLPDSWTPTDEHTKRAQDSNLDVAREAIKFRAHAEEKGRTAKNWNAAFTRWLINAAEYAVRDARRPTVQPRHEQNLDVVRQIAERDGLLAPQIGAS